MKKDLSLLRILGRSHLHSKTLKSRVLDIEKVYAPLNFGVQGGGVWTIFLGMDHFEKIYYRDFSAFLRVFKASATVYSPLGTSSYYLVSLFNFFNKLLSPLIFQCRLF